MPILVASGDLASAPSPPGHSSAALLGCPCPLRVHALLISPSIPIYINKRKKSDKPSQTQTQPANHGVHAGCVCPLCPRAGTGVDPHPPLLLNGNATRRALPPSRPRYPHVEARRPPRRPWRCRRPRHCGRGICGYGHLRRSPRPSAL